MKKEALVAIFFGILLGLTVAGVMVWRIRDVDTSGKRIQSVSPSPVIHKENKVVENSLEISQPTTGFITNKESVIIKGKAQKGSLIVAQSPLSDKTITSQSDTFQITFPLALGENIILVAAYPKDKTLRPQQKTITVYYLDEQ